MTQSSVFSQEVTSLPQMKTADLGEGANTEVVRRKPGRPRAIPETLIPKLFSLCQRGLGYRAVARELREEGISVDWSTIRRIIKGRTGLGQPRE
jgi:hypothetical protein